MKRNGMKVTNNGSAGASPSIRAASIREVSFKEASFRAAKFFQCAIIVQSLILLYVCKLSAQTLTFEKDVLPIFKANCVGCHGEMDPEAGLSLLQLSKVLHGSEHGPVVAAGKPGESKLIQLVTGQAKPHMPPQPLLPLLEEEIETLRQWIAQSAELKSDAPVKAAEVKQEPVTEKEESPKPEPEPIPEPKPEPEKKKEAPKQKQVAKVEPHSGPNFEKEIQPIFNNNCVGCHGNTDPQAGLKLLSLEDLKNGSTNGDVVVMGQPEKSKLLQLVRADGKPKMPPNPLPALSDEQVALIEKWIASGADSSEPKQEEKPVVLVESTPAEKPEIDMNADITPSGPVGAVAFHPIQPVVAIGRLHTVELYEIDAEQNIMRQTAVLPGHAQVVRSLSFSPDGSRLAAAGGQPSVQGEVIVWDVKSQEALYKIKGHSDCIYDVEFSPDGKKLATCSYDRLVKVWKAEDGSEVRTLKDHVDAVYDIAYNPDGSRLASVAADRSLKIWDPDSGKRLFTLSEPEDALHTVAFHPSGKQIAAAGADKMIRVWELNDSSGTLLESKFAHEGAILNIAYNSDGTSIVSTAEDRLVKVWNTDTFLESHVLPAQADWVNALALNNDGQWIAAGRYDGNTGIYELKNGELLASTSEKPSEKIVMVEDKLASEEKAEDKDESEKSESAEQENTEDENKEEPEVVNDDPTLVRVVKGNGTYLSSLQWLTPKAITRGETTTLKIRGKNIDGAELIFDHPGIEGKIVDREKHPFNKLVRRDQNTSAEIVDTGRPQTLTVELTVSDDVSTGIHNIRVKTPLVTSNALSFAVEPWAAVEEKESNNKLEEAQTVEFPAILAGRINEFGDEDFYRFEAEAGDEWVFDTVASRIGSNMYSVIEVLDANGTVIADSQTYTEGRDAMLGCRIAESGEYFVRVSEKNLRSGGEYRIHVTGRPMITNVFPLGGQRGATTPVEVQGFNLKGDITAELTIDEDHEGRNTWLRYSSSSGKAVNSWKMAVSDTPEIIEKENNDSTADAMPVQAPVTVNGRLYKPNSQKPDQDYFKFSANQGQPLVLEVEAQQYGSPVDSMIEILHADGSPIEIATVRCEAETFLTLADRDSRSRGMRLDTWEDIAINDYMMVGSEIIKVAKLPDYSDEDVLFHSNALRGWRYTYFGTTSGYHAVHDPAYKVSIHPPDTEFPPNGMPVFTLYAENDDGGAPYHDRDSYFVFEPPKDGDYIVKLSDSFGNCGIECVYRLSIHPPQPDFDINIDANRPNIPAGGSYPIRVIVSRIDGFNGPVDVEIKGLPEGFSAEPAAVLEGEETISLRLHADEDAKTTIYDSSFTVIASAKIDGEVVKREDKFDMITVTQNPDVVVWQNPKEIELTAGNTVQVELKVERHNGFNGRVPIDVRNLPHGVYVMDTGLNGIMVKEGENTRTMTIFAEPWVKDVTVPIFSIANVETKSPIPNRNVSGISTLRIKQRDQLAQN